MQTFREMQAAGQTENEFGSMQILGVPARIVCFKGGVWYDSMRPVPEFVPKLLGNALSVSGYYWLVCEWKVKDDASRMGPGSVNNIIIPE